MHREKVRLMQVAFWSRNYKMTKDIILNIQKAAENGNEDDLAP